MRKTICIVPLFATALVSFSSSWAGTEKVLHSFAGGTDGQDPYYSSAVLDAAGNLYGTTQYGGTGPCVNNALRGCGTVFELSPSSDGSWTETDLYAFTCGADGGGPYTGVARDAAGNLYGTTVSGGADDFGTVFEVVP